MNIVHMSLQHLRFNRKINSHMSATERLAARRERFCHIVTERIPSDVNLAEVTRVDDLDDTLRWRDSNDHARGGWVEIQGIIKRLLLENQLSNRKRKYDKS